MTIGSVPTVNAGATGTTPMATQIPIRNFVQMSMGAFSEGQAKGLRMMLNDDQSSFLGFSRIFWTLGGTLARLPKLLSSI